MEIAPKTITIAFDEIYQGLETVNFDFIEDKEERMIDGVVISGNIQFEED
jgi:protein involved in ribonucleotide reduction